MHRELHSGCIYVVLYNNAYHHQIVTSLIHVGDNRYVTPHLEENRLTYLIKCRVDRMNQILTQHGVFC